MQCLYRTAIARSYMMSAMSTLRHSDPSPRAKIPEVYLVPTLSSSSSLSSFRLQKRGHLARRKRVKAVPLGPSFLPSSSPKATYNANEWPCEHHSEDQRHKSGSPDGRTDGQPRQVRASLPFLPSFLPSFAPFHSSSLEQLPSAGYSYMSG